MTQRHEYGSVRIILFVALAGCGGSMAATEVMTTEVINACKRNDSGAIRIVEDTATCTTDEAPLSWNVEGAPGPAAPTQIAGIIDSDGSVVTGSGFTAERNGIGEYEVSFPEGTFNGTALAVPVVSCMRGEGPCLAQIDFLFSSRNGAAAFSVLTTNGGSPADNGFAFVITQS